MAMNSVGNQDDVVKLLNSLTELDYDAIEAYEAAIERLNNPRDQQQLRQFMSDHQRHTRELAELVQQLGGQPKTSGDIKQILTKGKVVLAGLAGDPAVLAAMKSNEDDTNRAYERALEYSALSFQVREVLSRNLLDERRHRAWIEQRLQSMDANRTAHP